MKSAVIAISAALVVCFMTSCRANQGSFMLVNEATESIAHAAVTVCGQTIELNDIQPSKSARGSYVVKSDSGYHIKIEFKSGKNLQKEIGYVTNGLDFQDVIAVTDKDIEMRESKAKLP